MTDRDPRSPDPDDELASAVLDGEATAEERARADADPRIGARVEELASVRDSLAAPVLVADATRDELIAAALRALDPPVVAPVAAFRQSARRRRVMQTLSAAAVVVLVAAIGVALSRSLDDTSSDVANDVLLGSASSDGVAAPTADGVTESGAAALGGAESQGAEGALVVTSVDQLANLLRRQIDQTRTGGAGTGGGTASQDHAFSTTTSAKCSALAPERYREAATVVRQGPARIGDQAVTYVVYQDADGGEVLVVYDAGSCAVVAQVEL